MAADIFTKSIHVPAEWAEARKTKNFPMADMIRDGLSELKITVQDLKDGTTWQLAE